MTEKTKKAELDLSEEDEELLDEAWDNIVAEDNLREEDA